MGHHFTRRARVEGLGLAITLVTSAASWAAGPVALPDQTRADRDGYQASRSLLRRPAGESAAQRSSAVL
jgi:hypothetical protein